MPNKETELEKIILFMEKTQKNKILEEKNENIKIKYLKEDEKVIKVIKLLFKMKNACDKVINFNKKFEKNLNINDYINEINLMKENSKVKDNNIHISNVAKFIAFGNSPYKSLKKYDQKLKIIQTKVNNFIQLDDYEMRKEELIYIKDIIEEELSKLVAHDYELSLIPKEIKVLDDFFKNNILNLDEIKENEINTNIVKIDYINYFNRLRRGMNIKEKYKFNVTFSININLLNIKGK